MGVFVLGLSGTGLMPTTERKARILLKNGKAVVARKRPFTIRLLYKTGSTTRKTYTGIDTGSQHIGIAVSTDDTVLYTAEVSMRTTMSKRALMETRKALRRGRRYRKPPYRHPKFRFHAKRVYDPVPDKKGRH